MIWGNDSGVSARVTVTEKTGRERERERWGHVLDFRGKRRLHCLGKLEGEKCLFGMGEMNTGCVCLGHVVMRSRKM